MSSFEIALEYELATLSGLSSKVFPLNATEGTLAPYIVYVSNDGLPEKSLGGYLGLKEVTLEINTFHSSYKALKLLIPLVNTLVMSFQSRIIGVDGPYIQNITLFPSVELWEGNLKMWRSNIEVKISF